ncbi:nitrogen permease regulator 3 [[Candida] anglica]
MSFNLPNSYLLGILLLVSTHSGPQLVFNYPPDLSAESADKSHTAKLLLDSGDESENENEEDEYLAEDQNDGREERSDESKWNTRNVNYYMGTKKDLLSFLEDQEKHRKPVPTTTSSNVASTTATTTSVPMGHSTITFDDEASASPLEKTFSGRSGRSAKTTGARSVNSATGLGSTSTTNLSGGHSSQQFSSPSTPTTSTHHNGTSSSGNSPPSTIFGIETDYLCETLCPPRQMCNSRFEILIDDLVFLGLPIHCHENGKWRSKTKTTSEAAQPSTNEKDSGTSSSSTHPPMNMFHLVFIMNPPIIETNYRIDEMFHYVISRLTLVLRYEQSKHNYVWEEVKLIHQLREGFRSTGLRRNTSYGTPVQNEPTETPVARSTSGRSISNAHLTNATPDDSTSSHHSDGSSLTYHLITHSSLCKLIAECFSSISHSEIANLSINNKLRSFQIPIKTEFHSLPQTTVPFLPGSHLSSTVSVLGNTGLINVGDTTRYGGENAIAAGITGGLAAASAAAAAAATGSTGYEPFDEDGDSSEESSSIIYFALLLLDHPDNIVRDIRAEPSSTLAKFIHTIKPTESLAKLSQKVKGDSSKNYELTQIKSFAFHLVYWRRARVIPPLNSRSVYIVSPMAPITLNLYYDMQTFQQQFPTLPSLPHFLKSLSSTSQKPKQYATIIPSRDHRDGYLDALAWLIRYGYVTQLHTFIWLKISRKVKMRVEEDIENEGTSKKGSKSKSKSKGSIGSRGSFERTGGVTAVDNSSKTTDAISKSPSKTGASSVTSSMANNSKSTAPGLQAPNITLEEDGDSLILDPDRATTLERRWINKIVTDECKLSLELTTVFYKLLKYMNGKSSLELLLLKEDISRMDLRKLLYAIEDHIVSVRHW